MSRTPTIPGRITGVGLRDRLAGMADLPVVVRVLHLGSQDVVDLDEGETDISGKGGQSTAHGDLDVIRIKVDRDQGRLGKPLTVEALRRSIGWDDHVKFVVIDSEVSFLMGDDLVVLREEMAGMPVCVIEVEDTDDA